MGWMMETGQHVVNKQLSLYGDFQEDFGIPSPLFRLRQEEPEGTADATAAPSLRIPTTWCNVATVGRTSN